MTHTNDYICGCDFSYNHDSEEECEREFALEFADQMIALEESDTESAPCPYCAVFEDHTCIQCLQEMAHQEWLDTGETNIPF